MTQHNTKYLGSVIFRNIELMQVIITIAMGSMHMDIVKHGLVHSTRRKGQVRSNALTCPCRIQLCAMESNPCISIMAA